MLQLTSPVTQLGFHRIDPNDEASLTRFLDGIAAGFSNTRLSRAFITEIDNTPPPYPSPSFNTARVRQHVAANITQGAHDGSEVVEAGDFSALAVWETTAYRGLAFTDAIKDVGPIRSQWRNAVARLKEQSIGLETKADGSQGLKPFYHLGFLVRNPNVDSVPGAISAVVRPWLARAEQECVPVWLEATYPHARDIYLHFGFRVVETIFIGQGSRSAEGWPATGEEATGVQAWMMIYDKHLRLASV